MGIGRYDQKLSDAVPFTLNEDYELDHWPRSYVKLKKWANDGIFVQILPLSQQIRMSLDLEKKDLDETITYSADQKAGFSTTLNTPQGPLRIKNVEYIVFKEPMQKVLPSK